MMRIVEKIGNETATRYVFCLNDDSIVEAAVFKHKNQFHLCVSTQVGCPIGCIHCATTYSPVQYLRNLTIEELTFIIKCALEEMPSRIDKVLSFSGHGEPSLNWNAVTVVSKIFQNEFQRFYVTTIGSKGWLEKIIEQAETNFIFYLSLHGSTDRERSLLIPNSIQLSSVKDLFCFANKYSSLGGEVVFNYMLHTGNSSLESLNKLLYLLSDLNHHITLRFTDYTPTGIKNGIVGLDNEKIQRIIDYISGKRGLGDKWNFHYSLLEGYNIQIACGQLRAGMLSKR